VVRCSLTLISIMRDALASGCLKIIPFVFPAFVLPQRIAHPSPT
jgi:hypothetical protein